MNISSIFLKNIVLLLFIFSVHSMFSQNKISGSVKDPKTGEYLVGASVTIKGNTLGALTDVNGNFTMTLPDTLPLPVTLKISYMGYTDFELEVKNLSQKAKIELLSKETELTEIHIVDDRLTEKQKQSAQTVETMDILSIKQTASADFYEGVGALKGVDLTSASLGFKVINTRGFNSTSPVRSLQLIDGVDNQSPGLNFSLGNFLGASELDVQKLELIAGANGPLYGPNAFNGVVYITTKDPFKYQGLSVSVKSGERDLKEGAFRFARAFGKEQGKEKWAIKANFYYMQAYDWEANSLDSSSQSLNGPTNPGGYDAVNRYGDENLSAGQNNASTLGGQVQTPGLGRWYRGGYEEKDLVNYNTENLKASAAIHYKIREAQVIASSNFGSGTTVYQGDNRYRLKDILFFQHRLEFKKENKFFIRSYFTNEDAGNTYDAVFTAYLLQNAAKSDGEWQKDYRNYWSTKVNPKIKAMPGYPQWNPLSGNPYPFDELNSFLVKIQDSLQVYHQRANAAANMQNPLNPEDHDRFEPGTARFDSALQSITLKKSFLQGGSGLYDKSALFHVQGEYKFEPVKNEKKVMDIILGANFRQFMPNTNGTIFNEKPIFDSVQTGNTWQVDTSFTRIINKEFGIYTGLEKKVMDEKLKLNATLRLDKNQNFDFLFSPALSAVYVQKKNVFRISFSSAIRNPTLADQYLKYDVGRAILLGNLNGFDSLVTIPSLYSYFNSPNLSVDSLKFFNLAPIRPEKVKTIEFGYRGTLWDKIYIDASYYYSFYQDFIGYTIGVDLEFDSIYTNRISDAQVYRIASNASSIVTTQGFSMSANYYFKKYYSFNANYSFNQLNKQTIEDPIIPAYNTPKHKYNVGVSGNDFSLLKIHNLGFNINYKWVKGFVFEGSPQFTGYVPSYDMLDAQVNWKWVKYKTTFKVGASNIMGLAPFFDKELLTWDEKSKKAFDNKNIQVYGGPYVGRMAYVSILIDLDRSYE